MKKLLIASTLFFSILAGAAMAQDVYPVTDVSRRAHLNVNAGGMFLTSGEDWSGASAGAALGYNLHPKLTAAFAYDHGFPINDVDEDLDVLRGWFSMPMASNVYAGLGYVRYDSETEGAFAQLVLYKPVMKNLDLSLIYAHVFPRGTVEDFEQARIVVSYQLLSQLLGR